MLNSDDNLLNEQHLIDQYPELPELLPHSSSTINVSLIVPKDRYY